MNLLHRILKLCIKSLNNIAYQAQNTSLLLTKQLKDLFILVWRDWSKYEMYDYFLRNLINSQTGD